MLLSDRIAADLRHDLASGTPPAGAYTLQALAKRFGVSLTPVRQAVAALEKSGHLVKQANGRLVPAKHPPKNQGRPAAPRTEEAAEDRLRREIIESSLTRPEPTFFREEEYATRFGVGRTILRRLFFRMAGEGLLEHVPRRGWQARPVSDADLEAFVRVRELLEPEALLLAWPRLDHAFLREVRAGNQPGDPTPRLDNRLHAHWITRCGNRYITDFLTRQGAVYAALFDYAALDHATASAMAQEHRTILDAILDGDQTQACRQLVAHTRVQLANARTLRQRLMKKRAGE